MLKTLLATIILASGAAYTGYQSDVIIATVGPRLHSEIETIKGWLNPDPEGTMRQCIRDLKANPEVHMPSRCAIAARLVGKERAMVITLDEVLAGEGFSIPR